MKRFKDGWVGGVSLLPTAKVRGSWVRRLYLFLIKIISASLIGSFKGFFKN